MRLARTASIALLLTLATTAVAAQVPSVMNYQGRLTDNTPQQNPISATLSMKFLIYTSPTGGSLLWTEFWPAVDVNNGIFSVLLGSNGTPLDPSVFIGGTQRYLQINVDNEELSPRQQIGSVGFAGIADTAADAQKLGGTPDSGWQRLVTGNCVPGSSIRTINPDGTVFCETDSVGLTSESDPQVGLMSPGAVPTWDGSTLDDGSIEDFGGNVGIGDVDVLTPLEDLHVLRGDGDVARIYATGSNQGSGMLFAGQSTLYGGGIAYDGDGTPDIVGGSDRVTFFRRDNDVDFDVLSYAYNGNDVTLTGNLVGQAGASVGRHPGYSTIYSAFWRDGSDYSLLASDTSVFLNAPAAGGAVYFRTGNATRMSILGTTGEVDVVGDLDVNGTALLGWERVTAQGSTAATASTCAQGGSSWSCFQGSVQAVCGAGKKIIGGGCSCSGITDSICYGYPISDTAYNCINVEDNASQIFTAYAICARVGN